MERQLNPPTLFKPNQVNNVTEDEAQVLVSAFLDQYKTPTPNRAALERLRAGLAGEELPNDDNEFNDNDNIDENDKEKNSK